MKGIDINTQGEVTLDPFDVAILKHILTAARERLLPEVDEENEMSGDPTEGALLTLAMKAGVLNIEAEVAKYPRIATIPFECEFARASFCAALSLSLTHSPAPFAQLPAQRTTSSWASPST